jgi:hypothetical protein
MKNLYVLIVVLFLVSNTVSAQNSAKYSSQNIFSYTKQISELSGGEIWTGFQPLDFMELKEESGSHLVKFSIEPNKPESNYFMILSDEYFSNHTLEENLSITFHEAFHAFERDPKRAGMKWKYENAMLIFEYQETSARHNALFNIESKILHDALKIENKRKLKQQVREFLLIRNYRQNDLDRKFVEFEKGAEHNEGLAEYAGVKGVLMGIKLANAKKLNLSFENSDKINYLIQKYNTLKFINQLGSNVRRKFYYTGSAQGFLLDRLMPNWKTEVQMNGKSIQDLLEKSILLKNTQENEISKILKNYNYENILVEEVKAVEQRKSDKLALLEKTLNEKGRKVTIDFSGLDRSNNIKWFDPMNVTIVKPNVRVHTREVTFELGEIFTAQFSQPVVEDLNDKKYISVVPEDKNLEIKLNGQNVDLSKDQEIKFNEKLEITSENLKFEANKGSIKINNNEIFINLSD